MNKNIWWRSENNPSEKFEIGEIIVEKGVKMKVVKCKKCFSEDYTVFFPSNLWGFVKNGWYKYYVEIIESGVEEPDTITNVNDTYSLMELFEMSFFGGLF